MSEHQASRTLVKSPPELWAECSDARSLARHLGDAVGEIRIKRLEPETAVAWEGERISGTVRLEPSGWGTKVTLTAAAEDVEVAEAPEVLEAPDVVEAPEPVAVAEPPAPEPPAPEPTPTGLMARFRRWFASEPAEPATAPAPQHVAPQPVASEPVAPEPVAPEPVAPPPPEPTPEADPAANQVDLTAALDSLGKAHHRPFSRA
jgi:hypothetical protein